MPTQLEFCHQVILELQERQRDIWTWWRTNTEKSKFKMIISKNKLKDWKKKSKRMMILFKSYTKTIFNWECICPLAGKLLIYYKLQRNLCITDSHKTIKSVRYGQVSVIYSIQNKKCCRRRPVFVILCIYIVIFYLQK